MGCSARAASILRRAETPVPCVALLQAQACLHSFGLGLEALDVPLRLVPSAAGGESAGDPRNDFFLALPRLRELLHRGFLERFARQHRCPVCDVTACVGVDARGEQQCACLC